MTFGPVIRQMREWGEAMERAVEDSVRSLAPDDDPAVEIVWHEYRDGTELEVRLRSGRVIKGSGPAKLEAIADAAERIGRA